MPKISKSQLIKLQKTLITDEAIGKKFKITRQSVYQMRKAYGIPSSRASMDQRNETIIALFKKGSPIAVIAKKIELSVPQVYKIIRDAGARGKKTAVKTRAKKTRVKRLPSKKMNSRLV